jgi:hypothetical protein
MSQRLAVLCRQPSGVSAIEISAMQSSYEKGAQTHCRVFAQIVP